MLPRLSTLTGCSTALLKQLEFLDRGVHAIVTETCVTACYTYVFINTTKAGKRLVFPTAGLGRSAWIWVFYYKNRNLVVSVSDFLSAELIPAEIKAFRICDGRNRTAGAWERHHSSRTLRNGLPTVLLYVPARSRILTWQQLYIYFPFILMGNFSIFVLLLLKHTFSLSNSFCHENVQVFQPCTF